MLLFFSSVISLARGQSITMAPSQPGIYGNITISTCSGVPASDDCIVIDGTTINPPVSLTVTYITPTDTRSAALPPVLMDSRHLAATFQIPPRILPSQLSHRLDPHNRSEYL
jgi:hypothetical protein